MVYLQGGSPSAGTISVCSRRVALRVSTTQDVAIQLSTSHVRITMHRQVQPKGTLVLSVTCRGLKMY
jgi:hypothetical protein